MQQTDRQTYPPSSFIMRYLTDDIYPTFFILAVAFGSHLTTKTNHSPAAGLNTRSITLSDGYSSLLTSPTRDLHSLESGDDNGYKVLPKLPLRYESPPISYYAF